MAAGERIGFNSLHRRPAQQSGPHRVDIGRCLDRVGMQRGGNRRQIAHARQGLGLQLHEHRWRVTRRGLLKADQNAQPRLRGCGRVAAWIQGHRLPASGERHEQQSARCPHAAAQVTLNRLDRNRCLRGSKKRVHGLLRWRIRDDALSRAGDKAAQPAMAQALSRRPAHRGRAATTRTSPSRAAAGLLESLRPTRRAR